MQEEELEILFQSFLDKLNPKELSELLDPCTKLTITLKVTRGHKKIQKSGTWDVVEVKAIELAKKGAIAESLWNQIFALAPFSETPERKGDERFRKFLLYLKEHGEVDEKSGLGNPQAAINDILRRNNIPCRIVTGQNKEGCSRYNPRIREIR